ncbi:MAG: hypothetical protein AAF602_08635 [Myxococcota bacterium]
MTIWHPPLFTWFTWVWCTALTLVVAVGPLVVLVRRRDPSMFSTLAVGAAFAFPLPFARLGNRPIDTDEAIILPLQSLAIWAIVAGSLYALIALITRDPQPATDEPPRPGGLASPLVLLGAIAIAFGVSFAGVSQLTGRLRPWPPANAWLVQIPLALLAMRPGPRAYRVRRTSAALALLGGLLLLGLPPAWQEPPPYWTRTIAAGIALHGLLAGWGDGRRGRRPTLGTVALLAFVGVATGTMASGMVEYRLWLTTRGVLPHAVPKADAAIPLRRGFNRTSLRTTQSSEFPHEVEPLPPDALLTEAWERGGTSRSRMSWLGLTPSGDVRVATLVDNDIADPWWTDDRNGVVGLRRMPSPDHAPRFGLARLEDAMTTAEVLAYFAALEGRCGPTRLGLFRAEDWTAQEIFDLCAALGCSRRTHQNGRWDALHPLPESPPSILSE